MAIDFVHFETDLVPVDGRGWRRSGRGADAVDAGGAHGDLVIFSDKFLIVEIWKCVSQLGQIRRLPRKPAASLC